MPTIKDWKFLESIMDKSKENIPKECRIGDTCFTSLATIEGKFRQDMQRILIMYTKTVNIFCW